MVMCGYGWIATDNVNLVAGDVLWPTVYHYPLLPTVAYSDQQQICEILIKKT